MEGGGEAPDHRAGIPRRIDSDEDRYDPRRLGRVARLQQLQPRADRLHVGGADVRAETIAEIHHPVFARKVAVGDGAAIGGGQLERAADLRTCQRRLRLRLGGTATGQRQGQRQEGGQE